MAISDGQKANAANLNAAFADINFRTTAAGTTFTIADNQSSPANVTGLLFDKTAYRSVVVYWQVYRKSTSGGGQTRVQVGRAFLIHDDTNWVLTQGPMSATDAGVILDVSASTGQVTYTSDANGGTYSSLTSLLTYQVEFTGRL